MNDSNEMAGWALMWFLSAGLFFAGKFLTYISLGNDRRLLPPTAKAAYGFGWVGMNPRVFIPSVRVRFKYAARDWASPLIKAGVGAVLVWACAGLAYRVWPWLAGWVGMAGVVLMLHFGIFHLLALAWNRAGYPVKPLMLAPVKSQTVAEFWGCRWNTAFHDLTDQLLFHPLIRRTNPVIGLLTAFLVSGLIHEVVITVPARGGYGLPTLYFFLQGLGLLLQRTRFARRAGLHRGVPGRIYTLVVVAGPVCILFPPVFIREVILPMLKAFGAIGG